MSNANYPELARLIKAADDEVLEMIGEANIAYKCSSFECDTCPFNYCDGISKVFIPRGYCGCIFADAGTELNIRKLLSKFETTPE